MSSAPDRLTGRVRARFSAESAIVAAATLAFIAFSIWWLLEDQRLPGGGDPGRHLSTTLGYADLLEDFDPVGILTYHGDGGFFYPPTVRLLGAIPAALGLRAEDWGTILVNLVFVPMLAAGCYLTGKLVYNRMAGMLAALFALGTPMVLSLFHVFLLDAPLAGVTAISLWALLSTDRFADRDRSVLAGALAGLGLMVKTTAPVFLVGPLIVMLVGGGWRRWRNLALAGVAALVVAAPWHLFHLGDMTNLTGQAPGGVVSSGIGGGAGVGGPAPATDFLDKLLSYGWIGVNLQYFLPLTLLFVIGVIAALREIRARRHVPELLAGMVLAYLVFALAIELRDPRYTLPLVVFVAVLATGWIAVTRHGALRGAGIAVLLTAVVINVAAAATATFDPTKISLPGDDPNVGDRSQPGVLTVYDDAGYVVGPPRDDDFWQRLLDAAERDGVRTAEIRVREAPRDGVDQSGFYVIAKERGIRELSYATEDHGPPDLLVDTWWFTGDEYWIQEEGLPPPCASVPDGLELEGSDPVELRVAVQRRVGGRYERWCDF